MFLYITFLFALVIQISISFNISLIDSSVEPTINPIYIKNITLTEANPNYMTVLSEIQVNTAINVCTDGFLYLFYPMITDNLDKYDVYNGSDNFIGTLDTIPTTDVFITFGRTSTIGCFSIFNSGDTSQQNVILLARKDVYDCHKVYTFPLDYWDMDQDVGDWLIPGMCETIILAHPIKPGQNLEIKFASFIPFPDTSVVVKTTINDRFLFNISDKNFWGWLDFVIYTPAVSFLIPTSSVMVGSAGDGFTPVIYLKLDRQQGLLISPSYSGINSKMYQQPLYILTNEYYPNNQNVYIEFNVKNITGDEIVKIYNDANNKNFTVTASDNGKTFIFYGATFKIYNTEKNYTTDYFFIEYTIYSNLNEMPTIETAPPTTTAFLTDEAQTISPTIQVTDSSYATSRLSSSSLSTTKSPTTTASINCASKTAFASLLFIILLIFFIF